jgi:hypothetical protein
MSEQADGYSLETILKGIGKQKREKTLTSHGEEARREADTISVVK